MSDKNHPEVRPVLFVDIAINKEMLIYSACRTKEVMEYKGKKYPFVPVEISAFSHSFYIGKAKAIQRGGQMSRFQQRMKKTVQLKKGKKKNN